MDNQCEKGHRLVDSSFLEHLVRDYGVRARDVCRELVTLFLKDASQRLQKIRQAIERDDLEEVRAEAHVLKGSCGQLGALKLMAVAAELESASGSRDTELSRKLLDQIETVFAETKGVLFRWLEDTFNTEVRPRDFDSPDYPGKD